MMAAAGCVYMLTVLLSLAFTVVHVHSGETDTYHVSAGHIFLLRCHIAANAHTQVNWTRGDKGNLSLPTGVEVRDGLLWFLPVQKSHNGTYTCQKGVGTGLLRMRFLVSVSSGECPEPPETITISKGASDSLPCKQTEIFKLHNVTNVRWMKDCQTVQWEEENMSVEDKQYMWLHSASERDAGKYTCLIDIMLDGKRYTAARSIQVTLNNDTVFVKPQVVTPRNEKFIVTVGMRAELKCLAYTGYSEDSETFMYWTVDGADADELEELSESYGFIHDKGKVFCQSNLSISKVLRWFLGVQIQCHVVTPVGREVGLALLQEADHSTFYMTVALCLAAPLAVLVLAASFFFFKVDLILAYRKLLRHFPKQRVSDGKSYDAYVSFLHPDTPSSDEASRFALQVLPEELEEQHGYSLYIRGRDDCPGEAMHDVIAGTVHQCRRLIIILSSDFTSQETSPLCDNKSRLCYEQEVGLHDALTQNDPKVILVETDGPVDYSRLPESLRYIKRKQGALKWRKDFLRTNKFTKLHSNRNFWKNLRYHMPPAPSTSLQTVV